MASTEAARFEGELGFALDWDAGAFPFVYRTPEPLDDDGLEAFGRRNRPFRVEQAANGELVILSPVGAAGSRFEVHLAARLSIWAERDGRGISFGPDVGCRMADGSVLAPDASWVANERWKALSRKQQDGFLPFCPPFIAEVRSPKDRVVIVEQKMAAWMEVGAELAWLIDPKRQIVKVYRPGAQPVTLDKPELLKGEGPIAGFELETRLFWE